MTVVKPIDASDWEKEDRTVLQVVELHIII
jgi:hypothetical protein